MLGDTCTNCHQPTSCCSCSCEEVTSCDPCAPKPCLPENSGECPNWLPMTCVFWTGDPIEGTPIVKGMSMAEVVTYLLSRIAELQEELDEE